jgi:Asp-tRNA(Asn)/Glu-tRNA(Gln) amidotransferase A subunit family amidase
VPVGFVEDGSARLPVGLHLQAPAMADARLLRVARMVESLHASACVPAPV